MYLKVTGITIQKNEGCKIEQNKKMLIFLICLHQIKGNHNFVPHTPFQVVSRESKQGIGGVSREGIQTAFTVRQNVANINILKNMTTSLPCLRSYLKFQSYITLVCRYPLVLNRVCKIDRLCLEPHPVPCMLHIQSH